MKRFVLIVLLLGLSVSGEVFAQARFAAGEASVLPGTGGALPPYPLILADTKPVPTFGPTVPLPVMAPELALGIYQRRVATGSPAQFLLGGNGRPGGVARFCPAGRIRVAAKV